MRKSFTPKTIRLTGQGPAKVLGELEAKAMRIIWRQGPLTVRQVRDKLAGQGRDLSFNAVMTVLNRLVEKGLLKKCRLEDKIYSYCPTTTEEEFSRLLVKDIIAALVKDPTLFNAATFTNLATELDKETLAKLKKFLNSQQ